MSVKMLLDVCFYKATVFSFKLFEKCLQQWMLFRFLPSNSYTLRKIDLFEEKQLFFSTWVVMVVVVGRERKTFV